MKQVLQLETDDFDITGSVTANYENKNYLIWGALPKETILGHKVAKKNGQIIATALKITKKSPARQRCRESHYLSCSPWQILNYQSEITAKEQLACKLFNQYGLNYCTRPHLISPKKRFGYRNKMEFSIYANTNNYSLALFKRAQRGKLPLTKCTLAQTAINNAAAEVIDFINSQEFAGRIYKSLIIRSNKQNLALASLFVTKEIKLDPYKITKNSAVAGINIYLSDYKSPASVPIKLMYSSGSNYIYEEIAGYRLRLDSLSFSQVNQQMFAQTVKDLEKILVPGTYLDLYSGMGGLSIPLAKKITSCTLVDNNEANIKNALYNIKLNKLSNFSALCARSEEMLHLLTNNIRLIIDPPRSGLHPSVVARLNAVKPEYIYYLSCNMQTQFRDVSALEGYKIIFNRLYNYFPATPHFESLLVLKRS